jgi:hypothetical protein
MSRNPCHFYLPVLANRPLPLFRESNARSRKRQMPEMGQEMVLASAMQAPQAIPMLDAQFAVAQTIANTITPAGTTVLLGFDNLVHFLDWLDTEPLPVRVLED